MNEIKYPELKEKLTWWVDQFITADVEPLQDVLDRIGFNFSIPSLSFIDTVKPIAVSVLPSHLSNFGPTKIAHHWATKLRLPITETTLMVIGLVSRVPADAIMYVVALKHHHVCIQEFEPRVDFGLFIRLFERQVLTRSALEKMWDYQRLDSYKYGALNLIDVIDGEDPTWFSLEQF